MMLLYQKHTTFGLLVLSLICAHRTVTVEASHSISLRPETQKCLTTRLPKGQKYMISGSFENLSDGSCSTENIEVTFGKYKNEEKTSKQIVYNSRKKKNEGHFSHMGNGYFYFCFQNLETRKRCEFGYTFRSRVIGGQNKQPNQEKFDQQKRNVIQTQTEEEENKYAGLTFEQIQKKKAEAKKAKALSESMDKMVEMTAQLQSNLGQLNDHWQFMLEREEAHRYLSEDTFTTVIFWTFIEGFVILFIACVQIFFLTRKFNKSRQSIF